eukprot:TRINITY_DN22335_c0_g1_i1.p1 TRINITY_DN22335_c0_g1~~TRINITY_DN22335_c0_g1_i1.p1  ORF type:complete len:457 (-),score=75.45 TRINITY_DN22335_c0_g1_i1:477-1847(-)
MIYYHNYHLLSNVMRVKGSILPRAMKHALVSAIVAGLFKLCEDQGLIDLKDMWAISDNTVMKNFIWALTFSLVFRTNTSYNRYWAAANHLKKMQAEFYDAATSVICFTLTSAKPPEEKLKFSHLLLRLFALLHAVTMEDLSTLANEDYPLIDIQGLSRDELKYIAGDHFEGMKPEIAMNWIRLYIMNGLQSKLIDADPAIVTRVIARLGSGLSHFHAAVQVNQVQFPFPYVQSNLLLALVHCLLTPLNIASKTNYWWGSFLLTLFSISLLKAIDLIGVEIDAPFGEDPNDLPMWELHGEFLSDLHTMLNPQSWRLPRMMEGSKTSYEELLATFKRNPDGTLGENTCGALKHDVNPDGESRNELPFQAAQLDLTLNVQEETQKQAIKPEKAQVASLPWKIIVEGLGEQLRWQSKQDVETLQKLNERSELQCAQTLHVAFQQFHALISAQDQSITSHL